MEPNEFKQDKCDKVFFEKKIPIEFKFIKTDEEGKLVCEERDGKLFDFNSLEQFLSIREVYPEW